jgi:hypothetical protein
MHTHKQLISVATWQKRVGQALQNRPKARDQNKDEKKFSMTLSAVIFP